MRIGRIATAGILAAALTAFLASSAPAQEKKLPPGMTPEILKKMMTPGDPHPEGIPAGAKPWFGCIPAMGYHYVSDKNRPLGPIYGYYNGKPVFTEVMITAKQLAAGGSWDKQLVPLPGYQINHVDFWWEPHGHPGFPVAHYDVHAWYVSHDEHMHYCGNKSGKRPDFV